MAGLRLLDSIDGECANRIYAKLIKAGYFGCQCRVLLGIRSPSGTRILSRGGLTGQSPRASALEGGELLRACARSGLVAVWAQQKRRDTRYHASPLWLMERLCSLGECSQAAGADVHAVPIAGHEHALLGYIGAKETALLRSFSFPAPAVLVPDVPAELRCLAADIAGATCHA